MRAVSFTVALQLLLAALSLDAVSEPHAAIAYLVRYLEGGAQIVANDAGRGIACNGLVQAFHPQWDVTHLDPKDIERIYKREYWDALHISTYPPAIRFLIFDTAVNVGPGRAKSWLAQLAPDDIAAGLLRRRVAWHRHLLATNPALYRPYALAWRLRDTVAAYAASLPLDLEG